MSDYEFIWLWRMYPEKMKEWAQWEKDKIEREALKGNPKNLGVFMTVETIMEKVERLDAKFKDIPLEVLENEKMNHFMLKLNIIHTFILSIELIN